MNIFFKQTPAYDGSKNEPKTKTVLAIINWHNHLLLHGQKSLDTALNVIRDLFIWKLYGTKSEACVQKHPMMTKITLEIASCIAIGLAQSTIGYHTTAR